MSVEAKITKPRSLTNIISDDIAARFGDGKTFTAFDFATLVARYDKPVKSATHVLRALSQKGIIERVGEQPNQHGGGHTKQFVIVPGAQIIPKTAQDYLRESRMKEVNVRRAADILQSALDIMTRNRCSV